MTSSTISDAEVEAAARALAECELGEGVYDDLPNDYGQVPIMSAQTNTRQFLNRAQAALTAAASVRPAAGEMSEDYAELIRCLRGWAAAFRRSPEHCPPSDPHGEFLPVDLDNAANCIAAFVAPAPPPPVSNQNVEDVVRALEEIASWKDCTLGERPSKADPPLTASELESQETFDRGMRMAFYRCADRARTALSTYKQSQGEGK